MVSRISGLESSPQATHVMDDSDLSVLFMDQSEAARACPNHEFVPLVAWITSRINDLDPTKIVVSPGLDTGLPALLETLSESILNRRCEIVTDRPATVFWLDAQDSRIPDYQTIRRTIRDRMPASGLMIVTGSLTLASDVLATEQNAFIVSSDIAIVATGTTPPFPFNRLCDASDTGHNDTLRALYRRILARSAEYWRQYKARTSAQIGLQKTFDRLNTELTSRRVQETRLAALEREIADVRAAADETTHSDAATLRNVIAAARAERRRRREAETRHAQIERELTQLQRQHDATQAYYTDALHQHELALSALRIFLTTPRSRARRLIQAARPQFVPFVPQTPTAPPGLGLPPIPEDHPAPNAAFDNDAWDTWLHELQTPPAPPPATPEPASPGIVPPGPRQKILFIAGEPDTPGVVYRCHRNADAARAAGYDVRIRACAVVNGDDMHWAEIVVLWRVEFSGHVDTLLRLAAEKGAVTIFDADDLVFMPHLARVEIIDGIRSTGETEGRVERCFVDMRRTMMRCNLGFATTAELAQAMRVAHHPLVQLLPNTFDLDSWALARSERRRRVSGDPTIRIIYATGTRTHQRDFALVAPVLAGILQIRPQVRLVLFREAGIGKPVLLMDEFPVLADVADQIEWRDMVPLARLPAEYARVDIAIAPLEAGNIFCEAKSEIKFFEAALASVPSVVSPTGPFRRIVRDGETGFLADTPDTWRAALLTLCDDAGRRSQMGRNAYHDVLGPFGPWMQTQRMRVILDGLQNDAKAAMAGETILAREARPRSSVPVIPDSDILFRKEGPHEARLCVVVTCFNYADVVLDALDSVYAQTLELIDLIVVDDSSTDGSQTRVLQWMRLHESRFNRLLLLRSAKNAGLGGARNIGMAAAETHFVMQLDADNRLLPDACTRLLDATTIETAFVYPTVRAFTETVGTTQESAAPYPLISDLPFHPLNWVSGNHIDAMALIAKWAWAMAGGYYVDRKAMGWEDYDLWCSFAEHGLIGHHVDTILAEYRLHDGSMTNTVTERHAHKAQVVALMERRHPWIELGTTEPQPRTAATLKSSS